MKPISLWVSPWLHSMLVSFPPEWPPLFSHLYWLFLILVTCHCWPQLCLRPLPFSSGLMALNDIHMPGTPIPFSVSGFSTNLQTFLEFDTSTSHFATNPRGFVPVPWMYSHHRLCCRHRGLKQPAHPKSPSMGPRTQHDGCPSSTYVTWSQVNLSLLSEPSPVPQLGQGSCPPGHSQQFGITCLFTFICLFEQYIPPLHLPPWELGHHSVLYQCSHTEGFNNSVFKTVISYKRDRRGSSRWEWMNDWRNEQTNEKQRFSVVQRIKMVWCDE